MASKSVSSPPSRADERVIVFIDGSNLYHVLTENCGRHDVQFGKFAEKLANGRDLRRTYYYNIRQQSERHPETRVEQEKFLQVLYDTPYLEVRLGISKQRGESMVEKGVDVMIAIDLVKAAYEDLYDTAILVSGDGDFFPAIQAVKDLGKHVEVAAFSTNIASEAARVADLHLRLTKTYFTGLWMTRSQADKLEADAREPEVKDEASSPEGENKKPRRASGRGASTRRPASGEKKEGAPTRRRRGGRQAGAAEAAKKEPPAAAPARVEEPRRWQAPPPQPAIPAEAPSRDGAPIRRTPVRRRIGGTTSSGNGGAPSTPPRPPALRRPEAQAQAQGEEAGRKEQGGEQRGGWLRRLGLGGEEESA